jgi:hypothetical protein
MRTRLYPPYARRLVVRATALWLLLHLVLYGFAGLILEPAAVTLALAGLVAFLVDLDARGARESMFHLNLGTSRLSVAALAFGVACVLEIALRVTDAGMDGALRALGPQGAP